MVQKLTPIGATPALSQTLPAQTAEKTYWNSKIFDTDPVPGKPLLSYLAIDKPIVFFDLETTGLEGDETRIVEMSLVKYRLDGKVEVMTERLNPEVPIPHFVTDVHGITDEMIKDNPTFLESSDILLDFIGDSHLGGYNVIAFDNALLEAEFKRIGVPFNSEGRGLIDVVKIYHAHVSAKEGGKRRLVNAYEEYCGKKLEKEHTAHGDIFATIETLKGQLDRYHHLSRDVNELSDFCRQKLPDYVDSIGKIVWRENDNGQYEAVLNYVGPEHRGKTLREVVETEHDFVAEVLEPKVFDFPEEVKQIFRDAMDGKYPDPPTKLTPIL